MKRGTWWSKLTSCPGSQREEEEGARVPQSPLESVCPNTTRGLNFDHKIKARAHKGDMRIGKTPKKLASICCP
jgi:hypothetical protein